MDFKILEPEINLNRCLWSSFRCVFNHVKIITLIRSQILQDKQGNASRYIYKVFVFG